MSHCPCAFTPQKSASCDNPGTAPDTQLSIHRQTPPRLVNPPTPPPTGKTFDLSEVPPDQAPVFSLLPDRVLLGPREAITTTINGLAAKPGQVGAARMGRAGLGTLPWRAELQGCLEIILGL